MVSGGLGQAERPSLILGVSFGNTKGGLGGKAEPSKAVVTHSMVRVLKSFNEIHREKEEVETERDQWQRETETAISGVRISRLRVIILFSLLF